MKKSVILILTVIYVIAIVFVGKMVQTQVFNPITYVTQIEILNPDFHYYSDDNRVSDYYGIISLDYEEGRNYELKCRAFPYTASNTQLTYIVDDQFDVCNENITSNNSLILNINKSGTFVVTVKASDGSGVQIKVYFEVGSDII